MEYQELKNYLISQIVKMRREFEGDRTPLKDEEYKLENLKKEYYRLTELDNSYEINNRI